MVKRIPWNVQEAAIQVCGTAFHYKRPLLALFRSAGVSEAGCRRYEHETKFIMARQMFGGLEERGPKGWFVQRRIIAELCGITKPDEAADQRAAREALNHLRQVAKEQRVLVDVEEAAARDRKRAAQNRAKADAQRVERTCHLHTRYTELLRPGQDRQKRGYALEELLTDLFHVYGIEYHRPYRTTTEQVDGSFVYRSFTYLVEARWRASSPDQTALAAFKHKVEKRITSTRGLFVSVAGFRAEVVSEFTRAQTNLILMDGQDLALILEGHISWTDALDLKIDRASTHGEPYVPLAMVS